MTNYTSIEEKLNFLSHLFGLLLYLFLCPYLIYKGTANILYTSIAPLAIYSIGLISVFATSSLYHFTKNSELKKKYRTLDHMAIFLLIGGTYTPLVSKYISMPLSVIFLSILWVLLLSGMIMKFFFMGRFQIFSVFLYVFLGSMVLFIIKPIFTNMPQEVFFNTLLGGILYLLGVPFYLSKNIKFTHFIWHIFILIASLFHYFAIYLTVLN